MKFKFYYKPDIICHLWRLISLNEIKSKVSIFIIRLSIIKLPGTIEKTFEQIDDLLSHRLS